MEIDLKLWTNGVWPTIRSYFWNCKSPDAGTPGFQSKTVVTKQGKCLHKKLARRETTNGYFFLLFFSFFSFFFQKIYMKVFCQKTLGDVLPGPNMPYIARGNGRFLTKENYIFIFVHWFFLLKLNTIMS